MTSDIATGASYDPITGFALRLVASARRRQDVLKAEGRFEHTCADDELTLTEKLAILAEEFGEVAREVNTNDRRRLARDTDGTDAALLKEVTQVAAVSVAWIEWLLRQPTVEVIVNENNEYEVVAR